MESGSLFWAQKTATAGRKKKKKKTVIRGLLAPIRIFKHGQNSQSGEIHHFN